jgi:hypothetical protein
VDRSNCRGFYAILLAAEVIEAADAARDSPYRRAPSVLSAFGNRALLVVPVRRNDRVVWLEDAPGIEGSRDFVRAIANMVTLRIADTK